MHIYTHISPCMLKHESWKQGWRQTRLRSSETTFVQANLDVSVGWVKTNRQSNQSFTTPQAQCENIDQPAMAKH